MGKIRGQIIDNVTKAVKDMGLINTRGEANKAKLQIFSVKGTKISIALHISQVAGVGHFEITYII